MTDDINKAIERAKELDHDATPGPWFSDCANITNWDADAVPQPPAPSPLIDWHMNDGCDETQGEHDANFIAESRTLLPQLVAEVERLTEKCADLEADAEGTDIYIGVMADTLGVKRIGKDLSCIGHAIERLVKERALPEWRPLSVLETIPPEKRTYYHMAIRREENRPELGMIEWQGPHGWVWVDDENGEIPSWATHCRFTDREGVPVPWAEVGL